MKKSHMRPDAAGYESDPEYLRDLIVAAGLTQSAAAHLMGIAPRSMRQYLAGDRPVPYLVQFAAECLAAPSTD